MSSTSVMSSFVNCNLQQSIPWYHVMLSVCGWPQIIGHTVTLSFTSSTHYCVHDDSFHSQLHLSYRDNRQGQFIPECLLVLFFCLKNISSNPSVTQMSGNRGKCKFTVLLWWFFFFFSNLCDVNWSTSSSLICISFAAPPPPLFPY